MSKTATKPATKPAAKPHNANHTDAAKNATKAKKEPKEPKGPVAGKGPGGLSWVEWFRKGMAEGKDEKTLQAEYVDIRSKEPHYAGRVDVLKRHAYRHRRLALGESK